MIAAVKFMIIILADGKLRDFTVDSGLFERFPERGIPRRVIFLDMAFGQHPTVRKHFRGDQQDFQFLIKKKRYYARLLYYFRQNNHSIKLLLNNLKIGFINRFANAF